MHPKRESKIGSGPSLARPGPGGRCDRTHVRAYSDAAAQYIKCSKVQRVHCGVMATLRSAQQRTPFPGLFFSTLSQMNFIWKATRVRRPHEAQPRRFRYSFRVFFFSSFFRQLKYCLEIVEIGVLHPRALLHLGNYRQTG